MTEVEEFGIEDSGVVTLMTPTDDVMLVGVDTGAGFSAERNADLAKKFGIPEEVSCFVTSEFPAGAVAKKSDTIEACLLDSVIGNLGETDEIT